MNEHEPPAHTKTQAPEATSRFEKASDIALDSMKRQVVELAADSYKGERDLDNPPEYLFHIGQTATVAHELLIGQPREEQWLGQILAWSHDIGRGVVMGPKHTIEGARILKSLGYEKRIVGFALAHHRWGLGLPALANGNFPKKVETAFDERRIDELLTGIVKEQGIAPLAVLLADNSKSYVSPSSFTPTITEFNESLGNALIEVQLDRGRFVRGGYEHGVEVLGMNLLCEAIPFLEKRLGVQYEEVISRARAQWTQDRREIVALWSDIAYHQSHETQT